MDHSLQQQCNLRLQRLERAARSRLLIHGLASWLALTGLVVLVLLVVLGWLDPPRWIRLGLAVNGGVLVAAAGFTALQQLWRILHSRSRLTRHCDRAGGYADTLTAAEEILRRPDRWRTDTPVRKALVDRLLARSSRLLDSLPLPQLMPLWRPGAVFLILVAVLVAGAWLERARPEVLQRGWQGLQRPWHTADASAPGSMRLVLGPMHVVAGEDLVVAVLDLFGGTEPAICEVRAGTGLWQRLPAVQAMTSVSDRALGAPYQRWEATLNLVTEDLVYRFRRGQRVSDERSLTVWYPPLLLELAGQIKPPDYTGLPAQDMPRLPAYLEAPQGSRLALSGRANNALTKASMITKEGDTLELAVHADMMQGELKITEPQTLRPVLRDDRGLLGKSELVYEIAVLPDRLPAARLLRRGGNGQLPLSASLELQAIAEDDYGLVAVDLQLRRGATLHEARRAGRSADRQSLLDDDLLDHGWQSMALLDSLGAPWAGRSVMSTNLGELPLTIVPLASVSGGVHMTLSLEAGNLALVPGDIVELRLVARDNRQPGPPGVGRSEVLRLQVPSSLEILRAGQESQSAHRGDLAALQRQSSSLSAELERLRRELLRNPVPEWDRRQLMQATIQRQHELQAELSRLAEAMRQDLEALGEQRLISPELMDRMDRLAELLSEHRADGMKELLERMRESLAEMSPRELSAAMEELQRNQLDLLRRMEAAQAMLSDLAREQQMEGLTELAAELLRKQQEIADLHRRKAEESEEGTPRDPDSSARMNPDHAEQSQHEDDVSGMETSQTGEVGEAGEAGENGEPGQDHSAELARRQEALAQELAALEDRLHEVLAELEDSAGGESSAAAEAMSEALTQALQKLQEQQTGKTMEEASKSLAMLSEDALDQMQQALNDLAGLYHVLVRSQAAMHMAMQLEQGQSLRNLAFDLLALSKRQEQLGLDLPTRLRDVRRDDLVRRQHVILQGAITLHEKLQEVASAAPREIMRMREKLDDLIESIGLTLNQLQEGRAQAARQGSHDSLGSMNQLVINLLTQAQIASLGGAGSCNTQPQLSQQLQQMAQEQAGLNAIAEQLGRQMGQLSQELRAKMQRLQQGQMGLAGRAQQLAEEELQRQQQDGGRLLGDIGQVARDMEQVGDELAGGLVTEQTLRRQERILSRLLDMHNASRERDWARRRESRTADETYAEQQGDPRLLEQTFSTPDARRWHAVEQTPPAYRELVRDYFRAVQRLHETTGRGADGLNSDRGDLP